MNTILTKISTELDKIPAKRIPTSLWKNSIDKDLAITNISNKLKLEWQQQHLEFTCNGDFYINKNHILSFLYTGAIKKDGMDNIKYLLEEISKKGIYEDTELSLVLPVQNCTFNYKFTIDDIAKLTRDYSLTLDDYKLMYTYYAHIGTTSPMDSDLYLSDVSCQVFFDKSTKTGQYKDDLLLSGRVYVHGPYDVNLADINVNLSRVKREICLAVKMGAKGYVLHVGKSIKTPEQVALHRMKSNILTLIDIATPECPVLLETPAGQGTELLSNIDDMIDFFKRINDSRLQICIDTCHVFASGSDPLTYLIKWNDIMPNTIKLVHFNDSNDEYGSRIDRHFPAGGGRDLINIIIKNNENIPVKPILGSLGYIGTINMCQIAEWCIKHDIAMVSE